MTLENTLRKKLAELADDSTEAVVAHQGWQVALHPVALDSLSCSLNDVTFQREAPAEANADPRAWAERISRRATGLLEPLKLLEVDAARHLAILRSATPTAGEAGVHYYEMELHSTTRGTLRRFQGATEPGQRRAAIPFTLTHEGLAKFIGDVTAE